MTPLRTTRSIQLLAGTSLAGARSTKARTIAVATILRAGTYRLTARIGTKQLIRGRTYLVRLTAVDSGGRRRALAIRIRA